MALVTSTLFGDLVLIAAQPTVPLREQLSWLTDVIESYNGEEERSVVRGAARRKLAYIYPVKNTEVSRLFNTLYNTQALRWAVPVWAEAQYLGVVSSGAGTVSATVDIYDYRTDSLALLWEDEYTWQVIEIQTVGVGVLNLYGTTNGFTRAWLLPLRLAHVRSPITRGTGGYEATYKVNYEIDDTSEGTASVPSQFLSQDIYYLEPIVSGGMLQDTIQQRVDIVDGGLGVVQYLTPWLTGRVRRPYNQVLVDASEVYDFRQWLYRREGKYRPFWAPLQTGDMRLVSTGTLTTALDIYDDDYIDHATQRTHIAVKTKDGAWYPRTITDAQVLTSSTTRLTLDSALDIAAKDIVVITFLGLWRLASDLIEMTWIGGGVCQAGVDIVEISP